MTQSKQLIIGSNSFLGASLSKQLADQEIDVLGVFHKNTDLLFNGIKHIPIKELDSLKDDFRAVYIISAFVPEKDSKNIEERLGEVNVQLVQRICKMFKSAKIIFCSSVSVYKHTFSVLTETSKLGAASLYGRSKEKGERIVSQHPNFGIVRISSMYGRFMKQNTFLPSIIKQALHDKKIRLFGDGTRLQNYIHVNDVARYLISAANYSKNGVFLATSSKSYSNKSVAQHIASCLKDINLIFEGEDNSKAYEYDNSETNKALGITPKTNFEENLDSLITWMKNEF